MKIDQHLVFIGSGLLLGIGAARPAASCAVYLYDSVHFNSGAPDFGTPPRRAILSWRGEADDRSWQGDGEGRQGVELTVDGFDKRQAELQRKEDRLLALARAEEKAAHWRHARQLYEQTAETAGWRGGLRDRVEALRTVEAMKAPSPAFARIFQVYLDGMARDDAQDRRGAQLAFQQVADDRDAGFLREHALYQLASLAYEWWDFPRAVDLYQQLLQEFPHTAKREAALVMIGRCALLPATARGRRIDAGRAALAQLQLNYPHTRFRGTLVGLQGRLDYLEGRYPEALRRYFTVGDLPSVEIVLKALPPAARGPVRVRLFAEYLRRLGAAQNYHAYETAITYIDRTRQAMTADDARRFNKLLLGAPSLAPPYFYYRLYENENTPSDLLHLAQLADAFVARYPATKLAPEVRVRLAEVYYQRKRYTQALRWAQSALLTPPSRKGVSPVSRFVPPPSDRALFVRGATLHKLGRYRSALADFTRLLRDYPESPLRRAAREELAILYEATGDLGSALLQYFALDYQQDIAFLLDVRMSTDEIEALLRNRPAIARRDLIAYSLGIRCLRDEKWDRAERWLRRVPRKQYAAFAHGSQQDADSGSPYNEPVNRDPLATVRDLRRLHRAIAAARSDNARADALFRYASYYSTHGTLLLYNFALWQFQREYSFDFWWNAAHATPKDKAAVREHMYSHEVYARSRRICLTVARLYPHAPVAPRALYRAACCARRLASFNGWWDKEDKHHNYWDESVHLMTALARRYPKHPLAWHARKYARVFAQEKTTRW